MSEYIDQNENKRLLGRIKNLRARIAELEAALKAEKVQSAANLRECEAFWKAQKTTKE